MKSKNRKFIFVVFGICVGYLFSPSYSIADNHYSASWQEFLKTHVPNGLVDYAAVQKNRNPFEKVVADIEQVKKEEYDQWSKNEKKAFWINAYNIGAIKWVVDHYPLKRSLGLQALRYPANSIQQIPDVWNREVLTLFLPKADQPQAEENKVSLNYIENVILRKEFQDPRIHFAIVCASLGCAVLHEEPYVSDSLDAQLDDAVKRFVQDPNKVKYDARDNTLHLSPILKWFKKDFEKAGGIIAFLKKYMPLPDNAKIQWLDYDWSLNEQRVK